MLPMAFWQLGNRQIFENVVTPINFKSDVRLSEHYIWTALSHMDPTFMTYNSAPLWLAIGILCLRVIAGSKYLLVKKKAKIPYVF